MTCPKNHPATSLYATKMADPAGVAAYGTHFGCETCDKARIRAVKDHIRRARKTEVDNDAR